MFSRHVSLFRAAEQSSEAASVQSSEPRQSSIEPVGFRGGASRKIVFTTRVPRI